MTETEWLVCDDAEGMIRLVPHWVWTERRARLFAAACCRQVRTLPDPRLARVIEIAERFADRQAEYSDLIPEMETAYSVVEWAARHDMSSWQSHAAEVVVAAASLQVEEYSAINEFLELARVEAGADAPPPQARRLLADLVREIAGYPFRPSHFSPEWRTDTAVALARQLYESRDFGAISILADALQDAGCDSEDILSHCRDSNAAHVRGCWVVDLVLGKE